MNEAKNLLDAERLAFAMEKLKEVLLDLMPRSGIFSSAISGVGMARRNRAGFSEHRFDRALVSLLVQGRKKTEAGTKLHDIGPGQILTVCMDMPLSSRIIEASPEKPLLTFFFYTNPAIIKELLLEMGDTEQTGPQVSGCSVAPCDADFMEGMLRLATLLRKPEQIPVRAPLALRDLHYLLLTGPQAKLLRELHGSRKYGRELLAVISWLKERLDGGINLKDLARVANMSESTLYRHFKILTGLSPLQYHKQLRLHEARRLILMENESASAAAYRVGYESASQFSREYKRLFGQSPNRSRKQEN